MGALHDKAASIFDAAAELATAAERAAYLDAACGQDAQLRAEVEGLLAHDHAAGSFLDLSARPDPAANTEGPAVAEGPGTVIGQYKLLEQIGEGGFGVVFMAEQQAPIRRKVALKIVKAGLDTRQVIARFEAERQALALMDHPNIAKVLDAGTVGSRQQEVGSKEHPSSLPSAYCLLPTGGRPYFVMELVKGVPITKYCDEQRLTPRERLELFLPVCQAIQHAHQKGIIHRDIKPSNVLVAPYDGKPVIKVIDFGVAKATGQRLTEKTLFTEFGALIGTLDYMSPEQAELNNQDIDTRSDIYGLGVLLYELLTGTTPLNRRQLEGAAYTEVLWRIREEDPQKPSTRLTDSRDSLPLISAQRKMEPAKLTKLVRGELDWIVMKCLEKDRTRRYESAGGLARDIQRFLHQEPVQACPAGACYRLRKFVRRNRGAVVAVSLVVLALLAGIAGTTWGMFRAERAQVAEAERAEGERRAKEEVQKRLVQIERATEILASVYRDLDPEAAEKEGVTLRALLCRRMVEAAQQLDGEAVGDPPMAARLQHVMGISLRELG